MTRQRCACVICIQQRSIYSAFGGRRWASIWGNFRHCLIFMDKHTFTCPLQKNALVKQGYAHLAAHFKQSTGFDRLSVYNTAISLFLKQLALERYADDNQSR